MHHGVIHYFLVLETQLLPAHFQVSLKYALVQLEFKFVQAHDQFCILGFVEIKLLMQLVVSLLKFCQLLTLYKGVFSYVFHFFFDVKVHLKGLVQVVSLH